MRSALAGPPQKKVRQLGINCGQNDLAISSTEFCQSTFDERDISRRDIVVIGWLSDILGIKHLAGGITHPKEHPEFLCKDAST
jgi:hypothetical protein